MWGKLLGVKGGVIVVDGDGYKVVGVEKNWVKWRKIMRVYGGQNICGIHGMWIDFTWGRGGRGSLANLGIGCTGIGCTSISRLSGQLGN